jgi:hypothetical protein
MDAKKPPAASTKAKCTGKSKQTGKRCGRFPGAGLTVCRFHGGAAPQVRNKAALRLVESAAANMVRGFEMVAITDPLTALSELAGEVMAIKNYLREQMEMLGSLEAYDDKGAEQIRAVFAAYERGLDRAVATLATIAKLNIDDRLARITEAQQMTVIRAIEAALAAAGIAGPQADAAKKVAARHLRAA